MTGDQYPALGFDPAPGDVEGVGDLAGKYRAVSRDLAEADTMLRQIVTKQGIWTGEASEAFARRLGPLPEYLDGAARSMAQAAYALEGWTHDLGEMQRQAADLERQAKAAGQAAEQARANPDFALANRTFTDQESLRIAQALLDNAGQQLQAAIDGCTEIQEAAKKLLEQHTSAAARVADLLRKAKELAPDEPDLLDDVVDAVTGVVTDLVNTTADVVDAAWDFVQDNAELLSKMSDVMGDIGNLLGVASDVIPPPVGEITSIVAAGFGVAALGGHSVAKAAGADVAPETLTFDGIGALTSLAGIIPGNSATATKMATAAGLAGYGALGVQTGMDTAGEIQGRKFEGPIDDFKNYWVPKDGAQWAVAGSSIIFGGAPLAAMAMGNAIEQGAAEDRKNAQERAEDKAWS
ncbi:putative T7SS-secreted protein [Amycolatopsis japonica]|uniref:putative T7SS-secreted protein n=1 Tax=Amycolatopsis japonica TaxID=208439 RepID=UPI00382805A3